MDEADIGADDSRAEAMDDGTDSSRRPWSAEEDVSVVRLVHELGTKKWSQIAEQLCGRTGKQCRERWHNQLDPEIKKHNWTPEEEAMLVEAHRTYGNKWAKIAACLPGRTDNAIKNHWNSALRRELRKLNRHKGPYAPGPPADTKETIVDAVLVPRAFVAAVAAEDAGTLVESAAQPNVHAAAIHRPPAAASALPPAQACAPGLCMEAEAHKGTAADAPRPVAEARSVGESSSPPPSTARGALTAPAAAAPTAPTVAAAEQPPSLPAVVVAAEQPPSLPAVVVAAEQPPPADVPPAPQPVANGARKRRSMGDGPDRDIAKGTKQVLMQNIEHLNQLWTRAADPPTSADVENIEKHVSWLQTFCDSLVESSLQASVQLVNKKRKEEGEVQAQLTADARTGELARGSGGEHSPGELAGASAGGGGDAPSGLPSVTPRTKAKIFSLTPGRGTPMSGANLLNELMHFDVDELLKIVSSHAHGSAAILASPRHRPLIMLSPSGGSAPVGISSAQRPQSARTGRLPHAPGVSRLDALSHRLLFSPRTAQQLAPPPPLPADDKAKPGASAAVPPNATPRPHRSVPTCVLSAARGMTPRHAMTPVTPGSNRLCADELLGFLNLDSLLTPANGAPGSARDERAHGMRTLDMSPFPMRCMPTPGKHEREPAKPDSPDVRAPAPSEAKGVHSEADASGGACEPLQRAGDLSATNGNCEAAGARGSTTSDGRLQLSLRDENAL